jgi:hypothetical protein
MHHLRAPLLVAALLAWPAPGAAQDSEAQVQTGARVENPPSGQNIRVLVHRAIVEPERRYDLESEYEGRVRSHPIHRLLRMGERRMEHCIDSAQHPVLGVGPNGPNTAIRARLVFRRGRLVSIQMSNHALSPLIELCLRAGFDRARRQLPREGRIIATIHLRPRDAAEP